MKSTVKKNLNERVVTSVAPPPWFPLKEEELYNNSSLPNIPKGGKLSPDHVSRIVSTASDILREEPNLLQLNGPFVIVGDIHGQFYDLHELMLREWCPPTDKLSPKWIFLGDYVDRGSFGVEVVLLLFAYKINFPKNIFLLRGNHELRTLTAKFNFKEIMNAFDCLPLACILSTMKGNFFAVHGGISPEIDTIDKIDSIYRFTEPDKSGALCDLLWADPLSEDTAEGLDEDTMKEWLDVEYCDNPTRGVSQVFGYKAVKYFLGDNGLDGIIRAHETAQVGYIENYMKQKERSFPCVVTVFSAPNYCGWYNNKGAIMLLNDDGYKYKQFEPTDAPYVLPASLNCCSYTLPFVAEEIHKFVAIFYGVLLDQIEMDDPEPGEITIEKKPSIVSLREKVRTVSRMALLLKEVRHKNDAVVKLQGLYAGKNSGNNLIENINIPLDYKAVKEIDTESEFSPLSPRKKSEVVQDVRFWKNNRRCGLRLQVHQEVDNIYNDVRNNTSITDWAIFGYEEDIFPPNLNTSSPISPPTLSNSSSIPLSISSPTPFLSASSASPKLCVRSKGSNGVNGMLAELPLSKRAYVYLRMTSADKMSTKFILIHWVPENIPPLKRAEVSTHKGFVKQNLRECSVEFHATDIDEIKEKLSKIHA